MSDKATNLGAKIEVRCHEFDRADFLRRCDTLKVSPADMLREMVRAFNTGRLKIQPTDYQHIIIRGIHDVS